MQHKVLLVDDEPAVTEGLKRVLYDEPFQILVARSAKEALYIIDNELIDVVVSDEEMPGLGGLDFLTLVWNKYPDTIRMLLTGKASLELTIRAINEGNLYRFFTKPCNEVDLATTIRQALKQKEVQAESTRLQQELEISEERYALATNASNIGVWDWNLKTNEMYVAPNLKALLGYENSEIGNRIDDLKNLLHPKDKEGVLAKVESHMEGKTQVFESEHRMLHKDGSTRWFLIRGAALVDLNGRSRRMTGTGTDITELKRMELELWEAKEKAEAMTGKLRILSTHDGLTKIANRRYFDLSIEKEWTRAQPNHYPISLLMADIDYFKPYNDHYGHQAGDNCLRKVAASIRKFARRKGDLVARYGGEEFVITLSDVDHDTAEIMAEKIRASVESLKILHARSDVSNVVTISIGVATMTPGGRLSPKNLIAAADKALYRAKSEGRNRASQSTKTG
ncbi:MAG: hypothetical protein IEMM0002_0352 [bacterium]|nr:MAG: hypothetical protein IEMM0002_0352 [bacterium]